MISSGDRTNQLPLASKVLLLLLVLFFLRRSRCIDLIVRGMDVSNLRAVSACRRRQRTTARSMRDSNPGPDLKMKSGALPAEVLPPIVVVSTIQNIRPNVNIISKIQKLSQIVTGRLSPGGTQSCEFGTAVYLTSKSAQNFRRYRRRKLHNKVPAPLVSSGATSYDFYHWAWIGIFFFLI